MSSHNSPFSRFFSAHQETLMRSVLNQVIPADEKYPGAGDLGLVDYIDKALGGSELLNQSHLELRRFFTDGTTMIEQVSMTSYSSSFVSLTGEEQIRVLLLVEESLPQFFLALKRYTYDGYYTHPQILQIAGAPLRPPQPLGHSLDSGDLSSLESVRSRGNIYKDV